MIDFSCPGCGEYFSVTDSFAGRRVKCRGCARELVIPPAKQVVTTDRVAAARVPMRQRRLTADYEETRAALANFPLIRIKSVQGNPPDTYVLEYRVKSLERPGKGSKEPSPRENHLVEVQLISEYPRLSPKCRMLTPIFHPNIDPTTICVGDHWTAGERLIDLVVRIGRMLAFQEYNIKSPLDAEAAMWADLHMRELPTDSRDLAPGER
jgi:ubiquitin-protein ligase